MWDINIVGTKLEVLTAINAKIAELDALESQQLTQVRSLYQWTTGTPSLNGNPSATAYVPVSFSEGLHYFRASGRVTFNQVLLTYDLQIVEVDGDKNVLALVPNIPGEIRSITISS